MSRRGSSVKYRSGFNEKGDEFTVKITDFPEGTGFHVQAMKVTDEITHLIVTSNAYVKKAQFSYGYDEEKNKAQKRLM